MNNVLAKLKKELTNGLPFMDDRDQGTLACDISLTVNNFGFLKDKNTQKPYVCFTTKEDDTKFYFGGSVVTDIFKKIETILSEEELKSLLNDGLHVMFHEQRSKDNMRTYMTMELI